MLLNISDLSGALLHEINITAANIRLALKMVEIQISPFSSNYILSSDKIIPKAIAAFLYLKRSVMILTFTNDYE